MRVISFIFFSVKMSCYVDTLTFLAYACVESISSNHSFDFYPPTNLLQVLILRPLRLFLPSRHPFLQKSKFALLRITNAPIVLCVTAFEQLFCATQRLGKESIVTAAPRLQSARLSHVGNKKRSLFDPRIFSREHEVTFATDEPVNRASAGLSELNTRLSKLEDDIVVLKDLVREVHGSVLRK
jgi:hypothetical protein